MKCKETIRDGTWRGKVCGRPSLAGVCKFHLTVKARAEVRAKQTQDAYLASTFLHEEAKRLSTLLGTTVKPEWSTRRHECTGAFVLPAEYVRKLVKP